MTNGKPLWILFQCVCVCRQINCHKGGNCIMTYLIKVFKWKKPPNVYRSNLIPPSAISKSNVLQRQYMILDKIAGLQEKLLFFSYFFTWNSLYNTIVDNIQIQPSLKAELAFFFPHVSRAQRLAPARTRTRVVRLGAQCTDHWTQHFVRSVVRSYI